ncbi:palmitoyl-protein thioesterase [Kockovaella imperatae]|uniref:Palmitoyl-protein thioesterase 1 n=1 Tax=Kockovaella imperatae TaxID=4999 RepID=A0A1Y1UG02_9TREE|nr:palmitoyl-protein thioesterase [Kockovaella imperatae]ORX36909.1 palmitoyl-protein thioesterase [Kockovaella imperatae]
MITRILLASCLWTSSLAASIVSRDQLVLSTIETKHRPLVIWHGLGDTALSDGISEFIDDIKTLYPGIYVHSVQVPEGGTPDEEKKAGFYGNATEQGESGCEQLANIPELSNGFDAMGFSQGGLFLRYYAQYCNDPPIKNLITFGTPHYGIAALIPCPTPPSLTCLLAARAARAGIYSTWAQSHLVQAAYFRDPARFDEFLSTNTFLRNLNGEGRLVDGSGQVGQGGQGLSHLENFIPVMFDADRTVSPAQSAHFWTYDFDDKTLLVPIEKQKLYTQDWIGLKSLDEAGKLHLEHCPGEHMDLGTGDCAMNLVKKWVGDM